MHIFITGFSELINPLICNAALGLFLRSLSRKTERKRLVSILLLLVGKDFWKNLKRLCACFQDLFNQQYLLPIMC